MFTNTLILSTVIFCISLVLCYIPSKIKSVKLLKTVYPYITIAAAGFMLAMLLMDFIPHVTGSCMHKSHQKNKHHSLDECPNALVCEIHKKDASKHKHSHDSSCEDHSHHDHSHHDH
ncbi:Zinc (Zn2+)-Iron (Fe2+) Permease (ZIP) Family, partial [Pseudoloma neurophilia]